MDLRDWFQVLLGAAGVATTSYGIRVLLTRRMSAFARKRWDRPVDAGMCFLCCGLSLVSLAAGYLGRLTGLTGAPAAWALLAMAGVFLAVALVKYCPRPGRSERPPA